MLGLDWKMGNVNFYGRIVLCFLIKILAGYVNCLSLFK